MDARLHTAQTTNTVLMSDLCNLKKIIVYVFCNYTNLKWTFYSLRISEAQTEVFTEFKDAIQKWKQNQPTKNSSDINISSNCIFPCSSHLLLQGFLHCLIL